MVIIYQYALGDWLDKFLYVDGHTYVFDEPDAAGELTLPVLSWRVTLSPLPQLSIKRNAWPASLMCLAQRNHLKKSVIVVVCHFSVFSLRSMHTNDISNPVD